MVVLYI